MSQKGIKMKNFILETGKNLFELFVKLVLMLIILCGIIIMFNGWQAFIVGLAIIIFGPLLFALSVFPVYLFIDIHDLLEKIANK